MRVLNDTNSMAPENPHARLVTTVVMEYLTVATKAGRPHSALTQAVDENE